MRAGIGRTAARRRPCARGAVPFGVELFLEEGAYTTLAAATAILMVLALTFSAAGAVWSAGRASDVQVAADATALSGANVVASYRTAATVIDACILSLGLAGFFVTGTGLVGMLVPGAQAAAGTTVDTGLRMLEQRNAFAASASKGLRTLEGALPSLVAAQGTRTCAAQTTEANTYTGTALAVPRDSASSFPALEGEGVETETLADASAQLDEAARELARAAEDTARAREAAWLADCGRAGRNMQERAGALSGITAAENPDFASSITWEPQAALDRTRAYYRWRLAHNAPEGTGAEVQADAAARQAFYAYASEAFQAARIEEREGRLVSSVPRLPRNTDEVKATTLYTEARWPSTREAAGLTLHALPTCPGATGAAGPALALAAIDAGTAHECPVCRFSVGDLGKTPAASTSIDNGFEYHLRAFTDALEEYVACRNRELEAEQVTKGEAHTASDAFERALSVLAGKRPRLEPPGRSGCVAVVAADSGEAPSDLATTFAVRTPVPRRGAIAAATLATQEATEQNNVLAQFLAGFEQRAGAGGAAGLADDVMDLWGSLLLAYGDLGDTLSSLADDMAAEADGAAGPIARWLGERLEAVVRGLGFEPVDLRLRKPVLVDSAKVIAAADVPGLAHIQETLRAIPAGATDPEAVLQAVGYAVRERIASLEFTIATIPLPGGGSIPLTVRVRDLVGVRGGDP